MPHDEQDTSNLPAKPPPPAGAPERDRALLQAFLAERDQECPSCKYNVRALTADVCPECNQRLEMRLALVEPRLPGFVAGLIGLSMGFGVHAMLAGWFVIMYGSGKWAPFGPPVRDFIILVVSAAGLSVLIWLWVRNRGRLTRASRQVRWALVVATYVVTLVTFGIFVSVAR